MIEKYIENFIKEKYSSYICYDFSFIKENDFIRVRFTKYKISEVWPIKIYDGLIFKDNEFYHPIINNGTYQKLFKKSNFKTFLRKLKLKTLE